MNSSSLRSLWREFPSVSRLSVLLLATYCGGLTSAGWAQSVTQSLFDPVSGALSPTSGGFPVNTPAAVARPPTAPFALGDIGVHPHAAYEFLYGDGIQQRPGLPEKTGINSFSPGLELTGARWTADYTPTWTIYSNSVFRNTVGHTASVFGSGPFLDGTFQASDIYQFSDNPQVQTGAQTREQLNNATLEADFDFARKFIYQVVIGQSYHSDDLAPAQRDWSLGNNLQYQFNQDFDGGAGVTVGYVSVSFPGIDAYYIRPNVSLRWKPSERLNVTGAVGNEERHFLHSGAKSLSTPTYSGEIEYIPVKTTSLSLTATRSVQAAFYGNQVTQNTGWYGALHQRLLGHFNFTGALGYQRARYVLTGGQIEFARNDDTYSYQANLSTTVFRRGTVTLIYQRVRNQSTATGFAFTSSQVGFELGYRY